MPQNPVRRIAAYPSKRQAATRLSRRTVRRSFSGIVCGLYVVCQAASAQAYVADYLNTVIIHDFTASEPGVPMAGLIFDKAGNLYGTESGGNGAVVEFSPPPAGSPAKGWKETVLYNFAGGTDGSSPQGPLLMDQAGNLYGTTAYGGNSSGTVFELSPPSKGQKAWTETILYRFNGPDGADPTSSLIADSAGNLYGTTSSGGTNPLYGTGTVFELSPPILGQTAWRFKVLYTDVPYPLARTLVIDPSGNLYGMTTYTAFRLAPPTDDQTSWTETDIASIYDYYTDAGLTLGKNGALYGVYRYTASGGGTGGIFMLTPPAKGTRWNLTVLAKFESGGGTQPLANLVTDAAGNLYGTASSGAHGAGTVFKLAPDGTLSVLHKFDNGRDGAAPTSAVVLDAAGNIYGNSQYGPTGQGAVWELLAH